MLGFDPSVHWCWKTYIEYKFDVPYSKLNVSSVYDRIVSIRKLGSCFRTLVDRWVCLSCKKIVICSFSDESWVIAAGLGSVQSRLLSPNFELCPVSASLVPSKGWVSWHLADWQLAESHRSASKTARSQCNPGLGQNASLLRFQWFFYPAVAATADVMPNIDRQH